MKTDVQNSGMQEKEMKTINGFLALGLWIILAIGAVGAPMLWGGAGFILSVILGIALIVALPALRLFARTKLLSSPYLGSMQGPLRAKVSIGTTLSVRRCVMSVVVAR